MIRESRRELERRFSRERPKAVKIGQRPRTWGDCLDGPRPCPWVACRYHLAVDVNYAGQIKFSQDVPHSCALDLAANDGMTLEETAAMFGITRERTRQIEARAIEKLRDYCQTHDINPLEMMRAIEYDFPLNEDEPMDDTLEALGFEEGDQKWLRKILNHGQ